MAGFAFDTWNILLALAVLTQAYWSFVAIREAGNKFTISLSILQKEDPGLRATTFALMFYHLANALLTFFVIGTCVAFWKQIVGHPALPLLLLASSTLVPVFSSLLSRAATETSDDSAIMGLIQTMGYMVEQRRVAVRAKAAKERVNPKYLVKTDMFARTVRPSIKYLNGLYGEEKTLQIIEEFGVPMEYLEYHDSPLNASFAMDLLNKIKLLTGDPKAAFYAQSCGGNLESMGAPFFILSRYCSIKRCYEIFVKLLSRFDTVIRTEIVENTSTSMIVRMTPRDFDAVKDNPPDGFYSAQGWFSAIPNLKGLPHAMITERCSIYNWPEGTPRPTYCEFEVKWVNSLEEGASLLRKAS